jgi:DNA polymerase III alpha subunit
MYPLRVYVWDAIRQGIRMLPPHVNASDIEWKVQGRAIRAGLNIISGLSLATMEAVTAQRPFADLDELRMRVAFRRPELQSLVHVGACDGLGITRPQMLNQIHTRPVMPNQGLLFDLYGRRVVWPEYDRITKLRSELDVTAIPFTMHPALLLEPNHISAARLGGFTNRDVTIAGFVATARTARTSDGKVMGFVTIEDASGLAEATFFPDRLGLYRKICSYGGPVWLKGKVTRHLDSINLECCNCGTAA